MSDNTPFCPEVCACICEAIESGCTREAAAQCVRVSARTLYRWLARGRKETEGPYCQFLSDLKKAEARAIKNAISLVLAAAPKSWQAAAWWLERMHPEQFASWERLPVARALAESRDDRREILKAQKRRARAEEEARGPAAGQPDQPECEGPQPLPAEPG